MERGQPIRIPFGAVKQLFVDFEIARALIDDDASMLSSLVNDSNINRTLPAGSYSGFQPLGCALAEESLRCASWLFEHGAAFYKQWWLDAVHAGRTKSMAWMLRTGAVTSVRVPSNVLDGFATGWCYRVETAKFLVAHGARLSYAATARGGVPGWLRHIIESRERCYMAVVALLACKRIYGNGPDMVRKIAMLVWETRMYKEW